MFSIKASELILNPDGSIYHLNLKPENIANTILFVGDQDRVEKISKHFDHIEFETQKREFKTHTGVLKGKRITVISTGIGPDNIDIVMNELDALVNIDLHSRKPKDKLTSLQIIRIGTSGSLQTEVPVDGFLMSSHGIDMSGLIHFYKLDAKHHHPEIEADFIEHMKWSAKKSYPYIFSCSEKLAAKFTDVSMHTGITATAGFCDCRSRTNCSMTSWKVLQKTTCALPIMKWKPPSFMAWLDSSDTKPFRSMPSLPTVHPELLVKTLIWLSTD
jgi:uridine phosphorylase